MLKPPVIVINSHVASGSVGGRASVFVLERMGFPVCLVSTVQLAWHAGHGRSTRITPGAADFAALLADIGKASWLGEAAGVLAGYLGGADQVEPIARLVTDLKARNSSARFLCDPIVGDSQGPFQPELLARAIGDRLLPLADIITPNRYELEWLTGVGAADNRDLIEATKQLRAGEVVVTSAFAPPSEIGNLLVEPGGAHLASHPLLDSVPHGTGDFLAAVYLGKRLDGSKAPEALEHAVSSTSRMIESARSLRTDELPLAASGDTVLMPPANISLTRIDR